MKQHTIEEITAEVQRIWEDEDSRYEKMKVEVHPCGNGWTITIKRMYDYMPMNLRHLKALSEFFNTDNINDSRYAYGGCETCDYGSSYEITLDVQP